MKNTYFKRISLLVVTIILFFSCKDNDEVICEKIVVTDHRVYNDGTPASRLSTISFIYQKGNTFKKIYTCQNYYYKWDVYSDHNFFYNVRLKKDTLSSLLVGSYERNININLNEDVGTIFHSKYWNNATEEEKLENGVLFEAQFFDTIFNDILPVRKCNLYSFFNDLNPEGITEKWHFYYDVDRCIYVHAEARNAQTGKLLRINKVVEVSSMSPEYFEKLWVGNPTENVLIPSLCIWD